MLNVSERTLKVINIVIFVASLAISIAILFIPVNSEQLRVLGYVAVFAVTFLNSLTLFIPGQSSLASVIAGAVLNPLLVGVVAALGSALGQSLGYVTGFTSSTFIPAISKQRIWYERIRGWVNIHPFLTIFLLGILPIFVTDFAPLIAGRMGYSFPKFLLATFLGKVVRFVMTAYIGVLLAGRFR